MASTFPQQKDNIPSFLDVTSADFVAINGYQEAIRRGDFAMAQSFLTQIGNADRKIISAERLNKIKDALDAVQQFYKTDIKPYIEQKQAEWQKIINQFNYMGRYSSVTPYVKNNIVLYNVGGIDYMYICDVTPPSSNIPPTNQTYWYRFTIQGEKGDSGSTVETTFLFEWNSATSYLENCVVVYDNKWWRSKQPSVGQTPQSGSQYWEDVMSIVLASFPVSGLAPLNQEVGQLWFKVVQ